MADGEQPGHITGVIFDYGRVLAWTQHQEPRAAWERRLGLAPGALTRAVHNEHSWIAAQRGTITVDAHWQQVGTALGFLLVGLVPLQLVLPALSIVSFTIAAFVALWAYRRGVDRHADGMTLWDVAGLFAVIWVGAGMLSTPDHVVALFDHMTMTR